MEMECVRFVVYETPYSCCDWDLKKRNLEFLEGIDATYYAYVAETNAAKLGGEDRHKAALSLRLAYSQGLETLFALICSLMQAPNCSIEWLLSYKNHELLSLVKKIKEGKKIYSRRTDKNISLEKISSDIHSNLKHPNPEELEWIREGFDTLWNAFATDLLDKSFADEYNGIKHGLRTRSGGFTISVGTEAVNRASTPPVEMRSIGGSKFGTSFFTKEKIAGKKTTNFRPCRQSRNWDPENLAASLRLVSMSINNVINYLKVQNGVKPEQCKLLAPRSKDDFNLPFEKSVGVISCAVNTTITQSHISEDTKESILESYKD